MARELAILVTARNMASGVLKDVKGDIRGIQSEAARGAQNVVRNVGIATVAVGALGVTQVKAGLESLAELERVNAQTAAALKSTGSTAAGTVQDIRARAEALEQMTAVDDKVIQNAENLLLTFTQIREDAFEPTLKAALDMNAAMGGDDESLQQVLIQVGKAVNDPIRGLTALRRVGVAFTKDQEDQVKALVAAGDAAGAQAIILGELNKEFGGSAAAQADTYAGKMKLVADAVEGAQMALATAFLPVIEKASQKLQDFLNDPDTLKNIEGLGQTLADGFDDALQIVEKLPWDAIGSTFSLIGQGTKAALDMFTKLPDWVQTAVLTGWGLNKLSGGALGNIVGQLGSGLIKGVLGMNAGVVNINAATVNGGIPGVGGGAKGGGPGGGIGMAGLLGTAGLAAAGLAAVGIVGTEVDKNLRPTEHRFNEVAAGSASRQQIEGDLNKLSQDMGVAVTTLKQRAIPLLESGDLSWSETVQALREQKNSTDVAAASAESSDRAMLTHAITAEGQAFHQSRIAEQALGADRAMLTSAATQAQHLSTISGIESGNSGKLSGILAKKSSVNVDVNVTNQISIQEWQRVTVSNLRATTGSGGFI